MKKGLKYIAVIVSFVFLAPITEVMAKPASRGSSVKLPQNLTTNNDWLDDGAAEDMRPNADDNDRYFLEQENFANSDPGRYSAMGSYLDNFPGQGWYY
ncbi:MAG: cellulose-binding protein [Methylocystis sp.]